MSLSEEQMLSMVPTQTGIRYTSCPNCQAGTMDQGDWEWVPQRPHEIRCKGCGEIYPGNPKYPDDKVLVVPGPGREFKYPYYERPSDGYRFFFRARADYYAQNYMERAAWLLACRYWLTGNEECARRAALILCRFAESFPGWPFTCDLPFQQKQFSPWNCPRIEGVRDYYVSRWYYWTYGEISTSLLAAYDLLRDWPGLKTLQNGKAIPAIEHMVELMVTHALGVKEEYANVSYGVWRGAIAAGRLFNRPEWVRESLDRLRVFYESHFLHDGCWKEPSIGYGQTLLEDSQQRLYPVLEGYVPPADASADLRDAIRVGLAAFASARAAMERAYNLARLPDGRLVPVGDTWYYQKGDPPREKGSTLLPGLRLGILRTGDTPDAVCAWLNSASGTGHEQYSILSIGLYAFGKELLSDIGYTHTRWRGWTWATASHNAVVVNGINSKPDRNYDKNRIRLFATDGKRFHIVEAESDAAYEGIASRYRRTLVLVGESGEGAYLIDVFQVRGGQQHDYLLHGSSDEPSDASVQGAVLAPFDGNLMNPGVVFVEPKGENEGYAPDLGLGFIRELSAGRGDDVVLFDLRLKEQPEIGTRSYIIPGRNATIYLGRSPQIRPAKEQDRDLDKYWRPTLCARRTGKDLKSTFLAVHEPVKGQPGILGVRSQTIPGGVLLMVDRGSSGRDYFVMAFDDPVAVSIETGDGVLGFAGLWGLARAREGRVVEAHFIGDRLSLGEQTLSGSKGWRGSIRAVGREVGESTRGWLEVGKEVDAKVRDAALLVKFPNGENRAYNVARIEATPNGSRFYLVEDPGFDMTAAGVELRSYPQRTIPGTSVTWWLPAVTHFSADPAVR